MVVTTFRDDLMWQQRWELEGVELTPDSVRRAFAMFPSGVTAVGAVIGGTPVGIAASSFTSVSLEPPLVSVCIAHTSSTWPILGKASTLGISVLSAEQGDVARSLASRSDDKFRSVNWIESGSGSLFIRGAALWLECAIHNQVRAGDHDIVLLEVQGLQPNPAISPLIFHASRFHRVND